VRLGLAEMEGVGLGTLEGAGEIDGEWLGVPDGAIGMFVGDVDGATETVGE
jgi:hypothetical protein